MEKLVYLLRKPADTPVLDFRKRLLDRQAPKLLEQGGVIVGRGRGRSVHGPL